MVVSWQSKEPAGSSLADIGGTASKPAMAVASTRVCHSSSGFLGVGIEFWCADTFKEPEGKTMTLLIVSSTRPSESTSTNPSRWLSAEI